MQHIIFRRRGIRRWLIGGLAIVATSFPAAADARYIEGTGPGSTPVPTAPAVQHTEPSAQSEFHWGDAGIGAAGAIVVIGAGAAAYVAPRRRRAISG